MANWSDNVWTGIGIGANNSTLAAWFTDAPDATGAPEIVGTDGNDATPLTAFSDRMHALGGDDVVYGNQGDDAIYGNVGNDRLFGGQSSDALFGGQGDDVAYGNLGDDAIYGNMAEDRLFGGQGNDALYGGQGDDLLAGNAGDDRLFGNLGADTLTGGTGADLFVFGGQSGHDMITDFNPAAGDRIALAPGTAWTIQAGAGGATVIVLSERNEVLLAGFTPAAFSPAFFV